MFINLQGLSEFASPTKVKAYMQAKGFERLVLLEDFVWGGTQAAEVIPWVVTNLDIPVLFCPMLICPDGMRNLVALAAKTAGKLVVNPVILLGDSAFISSHDKTDPVMNYIEQLILRLHPEIQGSVSGWNPPYSEHGYSQPGDTHTGATVVLFSNTPDNTIPLLHFHSAKSNWSPVFPRVSRETP